MKDLNSIASGLGKPVKEYKKSNKSFLKVALLSLFSLGIAALCF